MLIRGVLQDFVTLQKWDHHGAYDLKLLIEKTQRKLASCSKRTTSAASELITPALARSAQSIGIELLRGLATHTADESKAAATPATDTVPRPLQSTVAVLSVWSSTTDVPAVVATWMTSKCIALKQGVARCSLIVHSFHVCIVECRQRLRVHVASICALLG